MQKLTIFSIILSISIVLILGDMLKSSKKQADEFVLPEETLQETTEIENLETNESLEEEAVLSSESINLNVLTPNMDESIVMEAGFVNPRLKEAIYSGYIFQILPFNDISAFVYQWNLFENEEYIGSIYEIKSENETAGFKTYINLRKIALESTEFGEVNEANNYKDASFYFNHKNKTQTVHMVVKSNDTIYAFEYAYKNHETMKRLFEILP